MQVKEWGESIQEEVYEEWKSQFKEHNPGFRVFYGPVFPEPEILILGYQPGGDPGDFARDHLERYENGDFSLPEQNEYETKNYEFASRIREKIFNDRQNYLSESIGSNAIFFRSESIKKWKEVPIGRRREMEEFSINKVKEMIDVLNPKRVLILGMGTWDFLRSQLKFHSSCEVRRPNARLLCTSATEDPNYVGVIHPSGRVSNNDWEQIRSELWPLMDV